MLVLVQDSPYFLAVETYIYGNCTHIYILGGGDGKPPSYKWGDFGLWIRLNLITLTKNY